MYTWLIHGGELTHYVPLEGVHSRRPVSRSFPIGDHPSTALLGCAIIGLFAVKLGW